MTAKRHTTGGFLLCWLTEKSSASERLSSPVRAGHLLFGFIRYLQLLIINWAFVPADRTQNISTAESPVRCMPFYRTSSPNQNDKHRPRNNS